jgi:hypothetical protein
MFPDLLLVSRVSIEHALDEIASDEGGMRFQGLAVVLAKLRWPDLVACERKKDLGLDAYASARASSTHTSMGLSCSITAELSKIQSDATRAQPHFADLQVLVFATSGKVTNETAEKWKEEIKKEYGWELIVMSREDIITTLRMPANVSLCRTHLGIAVPMPEPTIEALIERTLEATDEVIANWSRRLGGKPVIDLRLIRLDDKGAETQELQQRAGLNDLLLRSHRIVIEAAAGRGKTTTLGQLARDHHNAGRIACLIDLPGWVRRNVGIFEFLADMPEFQSQGLTASHLASVNRATQFTFLLNGWNELAASESTDAAGLIRNLERSFAAAGIAVATRAHPIAPPLPGSSRFRIQPLTRQERGEYLRDRLGENAGQLEEPLRADTVLDDLTRTPMILAEVVSLHEASKPIPTSKLGVLDAVTHLLENSETHQATLADAPLSGMARYYLEELASLLVAGGGVQIAEVTARAAISSAARSLQDSGQIGGTPDPGAVLTALCSHHVLERSTYPDVTYTFFHQQFQELFAALRLRQELIKIAATDIGRTDFIAKYVNEPAWSQPLEMLAEFIGRHTGNEPLANAVAMGQTLVEMALPLDAVFASKLARLCGAEVWRVVRESVGARLRQLYGSQYSLHREIGLAGMVATGSEDFKDILVPLLDAEDSGSHLDAYRTGEPFQVSSLGENWQQTVKQWNEKARVIFVAEMIQRGRASSEVIAFALADPSATVRKSLLSHVWWAMSVEEIARFSQSLDEGQFRDLITGMPAAYIPMQLRPRAVATYAALATESTDPLDRFIAWKEAALLGDARAIEQLKEPLSHINVEQIRKLESRDLQSTVEMLRKTDAAWVNDWVINKIMAGALDPDGWMQMVNGISVALRDELLDRATTQNLSEMRVPGVIPLLQAFPDREVVRRLFRRLCELVPIIAASKPGDDKQAEAKLASQMQDLLRGIVSEVVVESILHELNGSTNAVEIKIIGEIFHAVGRRGLSLREALPRALREQFHAYLISAMATILTQDDPYGQVKAYFATVLAQVGDVSDLPEMERLIAADLERVRAERAARMAVSVRSRGRPKP